MNKSRFDLRALVSLTCTVDGEEKQLPVLLDGIVRQADDSIGMFYDDLCEQVSRKLPTAHAKAFLEDVEIARGWALEFLKGRIVEVGKK